MNEDLNTDAVVENTESKETNWNNVMDNVSLDDYKDESKETTESQEEKPSEVETSNEPVTETNDAEDTSDYVLDIEGKEFGINDIMGWKQEADNKGEWTKSNTQKSQNLARMKNLSDELVNDEGLRNAVKDYYSSDTEKLNKLGLDELKSLDGGAPVINTEPTPQDNSVKDANEDVVNSKLEKLSGEMREMAVERRVKQYESELSQLEQNFPDLLGEDKTMDFLKFAQNNGETNLLRAFKEWSFPQMADKLKHSSELDKNKTRNQGKVVNTSNAGSKGNVTDGKVKSWNDVSSDNPEIKKYFER